MSGRCSVYGDLKDNFGDLEEDNNLVNFFLAVLDRRDQFEEEGRRCEDTHSVKDTLGASSILGLPGIRTRRREELILFAD
jgi:hypothetical protein